MINEYWNHNETPEHWQVVEVKIEDGDSMHIEKAVFDSRKGLYRDAANPDRFLCHVKAWRQHYELKS